MTILVVKIPANLQWILFFVYRTYTVEQSELWLNPGRGHRWYNLCPRLNRHYSMSKSYGVWNRKRFSQPKCVSSIHQTLGIMERFRKNWLLIIKLTEWIITWYNWHVRYRIERYVARSCPYWSQSNKVSMISTALWIEPMTFSQRLNRPLFDRLRPMRNHLLLDRERWLLVIPHYINVLKLFYHNPASSAMKINFVGQHFFQ